MIPSGQLTGAVLAGGESRRMGCDKAILIVGDLPLWQRQVNVLRTAGASLVGVVRRPGQPPLQLPADIPLWQDAVSGIGPLAGLHAALTTCRTPWLAVVATDLPRLEAGWFQWLGGLCSAGCGAMARLPDGPFEPLAAIYPKAALAEVTRRLAGPEYSLQSLTATLVAQQHLVTVTVPDTDLGQLENWNTPAETDSLRQGEFRGPQNHTRAAG